MTRAHWIAAIGALSALLFAIDAWLRRLLYLLAIAFAVLAFFTIPRL